MIDARIWWSGARKNPKYEARNPKWFDKDIRLSSVAVLTILSKVEGQIQNSNDQTLKLATEDSETSENSIIFNRGEHRGRRVYKHMHIYLWSTLCFETKIPACAGTSWTDLPGEIQRRIVKWLRAFSGSGRWKVGKRTIVKWLRDSSRYKAEWLILKKVLPRRTQRTQSI